MDKNKQKKLLAKWVNATQMIEGKDKNTYIVLRPPNELPDLKPMNGPIEFDYSIYPKLKKMTKVTRNWKVIVKAYNFNELYGTFSSVFDHPPTEEDILDTYGKSLVRLKYGSKEVYIEEFYKIEGYEPQQD